MKPLDQGGMGAVYEVLDTRGGQALALKLMHGLLARDPEFLSRFEQEIRIGRAIKSEHVVEVLDHGVDQMLGPYFVMELCPGESLHAYVDRVGRLGANEARTILEQVGEALARAHAASVVHRDLKPANVLLVGSSRTVKVLDFGVAKVTGYASQAGNSRAIGTPAWMAPEQFSAGDWIDPRTDIWAYGLLAFYVLVGRTFWRAAVGQDAEIIREICVDRLPRASARAAELGAPATLPQGFDDWFAACVNRERVARFGNMAAALAALRSVFPMKVKLINPVTPPPSAVAPINPEDTEIQAAIDALAQRLPAALAAMDPPAPIQQPPRAQKLANQWIQAPPQISAIPAVGSPRATPVVQPPPIPVVRASSQNARPVLIVFAAVGGIVAMVLVALSILVLFSIVRGPPAPDGGAGSPEGEF
ncbi:serine/threonine-protein kinase [Polyangium sp. 15x6]|uniref:serine/threonine-protein kinase n=1 Tax=Polyangium sp. 15x6 TaxID=3042687 RepID=UPI00249B6B48|nr:serine/threonine-protein kinase [Polyangium sp. 15x6]MDI3291658.1 protein kinase [Polyangium sp. 15x6]